MTFYAYTLTNPGAETGDTTGWTSRSGGVPAARASGADVAAYAGSYYFAGTASGATAVWDQQIAVDPSHEAGIDAGTYGVRASAYHTGFTDADSGALYIECYASDGTTLLGREIRPQSDPSVWTLETVSMVCPVGTRFFRIGTDNVRVTGTQLSAYWDAFVLEVTDAPATDLPVSGRITSLAAEVVYTPAAAPNARITALATEVIYTPAAASSARITALAVEVIRSVESVVVASRRRQACVVN